MIKILQHTRHPDIVVHRKGLIEISARVARQLNLNAGDAINVLISGKEFLLFIDCPANDIVGRVPAVCTPSKNNSKHFRCNCAILARAILDAGGVAADRAAFFAGYPSLINGKPHIPIITRNPKI